MVSNILVAMTCQLNHIKMVHLIASFVMNERERQFYTSGKYVAAGSCHVSTYPFLRWCGLKQFSL